MHFTWNVTDYSKYKFEIQLDFEDTYAVSSMQESDSVRIEFIEPLFFFDFAGQMIPSSTILERQLPTQLPSNSEMILAVAETLETGSKLVLSTNFALNLFLSAGLNHFWAMVNAQ